MQTQGVPDIATSCARPRLARGILQRDEEIHRDEINVAYILGLLLGLKNLKPEEAKKRQKEILDMVTTDVQLRSKRELIKTFIEERINPATLAKLLGASPTRYDSKNKHVNEKSPLERGLRPE